MSYINSNWSNFFMRNKQFVRFYQSLGLFTKMYIAPSSSFLNKTISDTSAVQSLNFYSCSTKVVSSILNKSSNSLFLPKLKESKYIYLSTFDNEFIKSINLVSVGDKHLNYDQNFLKPNLLENFYIFNKILYKSNQLVTLDVYKINILLTLLNSFK